MKLEAYEDQTVVCHNCGETKVVRTHVGIIKSYCSDRCKDRAGTRRRRRRRARERRGEAVPCPTPDKVPYDTRALAEAAAHNELVANDRVRYAYERVCRCGSWHISSQEQEAWRSDPARRQTEPQPVPAISPDQLRALQERFPPQ